MLGHLAAAIFIAFIEAEKYFPKGRCLLCGNPTRASLKQTISKKQALQKLHVTRGGNGSTVRAN